MKRVSICPEFKQLSACTVLMPNNAVLDELHGKNWFVHALALTTNPAKTFFTSIMQLMHNAMQVWNQLLVICLNTPPQPTWGHSMHFYDQAPRPPPFNQITQRGCQSTGLELRNLKILYFVKVAL